MRSKAVTFCASILFILLFLVGREATAVSFPRPTSMQGKPVGAYDILSACSTAPGWLSFSSIPDWEVIDFAKASQAAQCSRTRGTKWIILMGFGDSPVTPVLNRALQT